MKGSALIKISISVTISLFLHFIFFVYMYRLEDICMMTGVLLTEHDFSEPKLSVDRLRKKEDAFRMTLVACQILAK